MFELSVHNIISPPQAFSIPKKSLDNTYLINSLKRTQNDFMQISFSVIFLYLPLFVLLFWFNSKFKVSFWPLIIKLSLSNSLIMYRKARFILFHKAFRHFSICTFYISRTDLLQVSCTLSGFKKKLNFTSKTNSISFSAFNFKAIEITSLIHT